VHVKRFVNIPKIQILILKKQIFVLSFTRDMIQRSEGMFMITIEYLLLR
jgi:hypothetical protein